MKFFKGSLAFLFIAIALFLFAVFFIRIENDIPSFNKSDNSANKDNAEISTDESIQDGPKKLFKNTEAKILSSINFNTYSYSLDITEEFLPMLKKNGGKTEIHPQISSDGEKVIITFSSKTF